MPEFNIFENKPEQIEEIEVRADGSVRTGAVKEDFRCAFCTMMLPPMQRGKHPYDKDMSICYTCQQEYF